MWMAVEVEELFNIVSTRASEDGDECKVALPESAEADTREEGIRAHVLTPFSQSSIGNSLL